ncbi:hypothetical protein C0989_009127 [Termitomyces sp. Mn162]|nr:hypothetical protein C0989_009127 [Termitomyces sp. Mn162]
MGFFAAPAPPAVACDVSFHLPTPRATSRPRPSRSSSPLPLPPELVLSIIEHAACPDGTPHQTLLCHCALVCKAWSLAAQKLLFTSVSLRSQRACDAFLAATDPCTPKGRTLRDAVVRLSAVIDHNQPRGLSQHALAVAVSRCARLYDLTLSLYGRACSTTQRMRRPAPSFDDWTLSQLLAGPRISSLQFTNWSDNSHALAQLLAVWPSLHSLSITGSTPPEPPSPFLSPFPGILSSLRMNFQSLPSLEFLNWLTHTAALRILDFEREPPTQVLQALVDAHGAGIHSLALPACTQHEHARAVQRCTQLRELRIESLGPCVAARVLRALPASVRHVALGVDMNTPLQLLVDLVKARGGEQGEALRVLTLYTMNGGEKHVLLNPLKMACAVKGVQMRVVGDVGTFREQLRGDPVPTWSFPRVKSLSNIYIMRSGSSVS